MVSLIKVINLDKRPERFKEFDVQIKKSNLQNCKIERFSAIDGSNLLDDIKNKNLKDDVIFEVLRTLNAYIPRGELGCFLSHYFILKEIIFNENINDDDLILIFEDDVFFTEYDDSKFYEHIEEFKKTNKIDFLYLSGRWKKHYMPNITSMNFFERQSKHFFKRIDGKGYDWDRCAPAYMCSKTGAKLMCEKIILQLKNNKCWSAIDNIYGKSSKNLISYDFFPHIYYAKMDYKTDIQGKHLLNVINSSDLIFNL